MALPIPWFWTSSLLNWEKTNFFCLKPPNYAALGKQDTYYLTLAMGRVWTTLGAVFSFWKFPVPVHIWKVLRSPKPRKCIQHFLIKYFPNKWPRDHFLIKHLLAWCEAKAPRSTLGEMLLITKQASSLDNPGLETATCMALFRKSPSRVNYLRISILLSALGREKRHQETNYCRKSYENAIHSSKQDGNI